MSIASEITRLQGAKADLKSSINAKNGSGNQITTETLEDYSTYVNAIQTRKPEQTKTATPTTSSQTITPDSGYALSSVTVNAMPSGALSNPTINSSTGVVTASVGTSGYLASGTSKTLQLTTQGAQTITPSTTNQTIASGKYLTGTQTISGDANLISSNIKQGVSIFGVNGSIPNNVKIWIVNHTSSGSTGETITLATNDSWVAANYNNETLAMFITSVTANELAAKTLYGLIQTNTTPYGGYAGRSFRTSLSSTSWSDNGISRKIMDTGDAGFVATSTGSLTFRARDNGSVLYLPTGTYIIVAAISQ